MWCPPGEDGSQPTKGPLRSLCIVLIEDGELHCKSVIIAGEIKQNHTGIVVMSHSYTCPHDFTADKRQLKTYFGDHLTADPIRIFSETETRRGANSKKGISHTWIEY